MTDKTCFWCKEAGRNYEGHSGISCKQRPKTLPQAYLSGKTAGRKEKIAIERYCSKCGLKMTDATEVDICGLLDRIAVLETELKTYKEFHATDNKHFDMLETENARLRNALEKIAQYPKLTPRDDNRPEVMFYGCKQLAKKALEALEGK